MDGVQLRLARGLLQDALQGEAVRLALHLVAEDAGELGEALQLGRLRGGMDAAQETARPGLSRCSATASLAASMNSSIDLMADVVLAEMSAADSALLVVLQLDLRHRSVPGRRA